VTEIQRQKKCPIELLFWALIYTWRQNLYTGNIFFLDIQQTIKRKIKKKMRGFFYGLQVGVEILTSKIRHENQVKKV
jgi:hypothetical protein